jgi:nucleoside-triphosphatase THEP1
MSKISILTGEIRTGKTTRLMRWAASQKNIDGIFQPVIDEKRFVYHIGSRTLKPLETTETENVTSIGRYNFSNETFSWSQKILNDCLHKKLDWIIVDEIGPLELDGKGLEPAISKLFSEQGNIKAKIVCVVRDSIIEKFIELYGLQNEYQIFELED